MQSVSLMNHDLCGVGFQGRYEKDGQGFRSGHYDVGGMHALATYLKTTATLTSLTLSRCRVAGLDVSLAGSSLGLYNPAGVIVLCDALIECRSLTFLDLTANNILEQGGDQLEKVVFARSPGVAKGSGGVLGTIHPWGNKLPLQQLTRLMQATPAFGTFGGIEHLDLSGRCLSSTDADALFSLLLDGVNNIRSLDISDNITLGISAVKALCTRLLPAGKLHTLKMCNVVPPGDGPATKELLVASKKRGLQRLDASPVYLYESEARS